MKQDATEQDAAHGEAIAAILSTPSITEAADSLGVSRSTVYRWLDDDDFQAELKQARTRVFEAALSRMQSGLSRVTDELFRIATNKQVKPATRVSACRWYIDAALRSHELLNLSERVDAIERLLAGEEE